MLRSKKRKNNSSRILIVFGKGIASALSLELAMLFSQSGFDVKTAFLDGAEAWVTENSIKSVVGSSVLSRVHHPSWSLRTNIQFDCTVFISPQKHDLTCVFANTSDNPVIEFSKSNSSAFFILHEKHSLTADPVATEIPCFLSELPAANSKIASFFEQSFSEIVKFLHNRQLNKTKTFHISYDVPEPLNKHFCEKPGWIAILSRELQQRGIKKMSPEESTCDLLIEAYDGPRISVSKNKKKHELITEMELELNTEIKAPLNVKFVFPESEFEINENGSSNNLFFAKRLKNGIELATPSCNRIIPNLDGQCCFARLSDVLLSHLSSIDNG